jgi:hypothetical protein
VIPALESLVGFPVRTLRQVITGFILQFIIPVGNVRPSGLMQSTTPEKLGFGRCRGQIRYPRQIMFGRFGHIGISREA